MWKEPQIESRRRAHDAKAGRLPPAAAVFSCLAVARGWFPTSGRLSDGQSWASNPEIGFGDGPRGAAILASGENDAAGKHGIAAGRPNRLQGQSSAHHLSLIS
jgi:hypothetical protein